MGTKAEPGIILRAASYIFQYIRTHEDLDFLIRMSFIELYNEEVFDLFGARDASLAIRERDVRWDLGSLFIC